MSYQHAEVGDGQAEQVDVHDPFQLRPRQDEDAEDVADDADGHEDVCQHAVGEPVDQVDGLLLLRGRGRIQRLVHRLAPVGLGFEARLAPPRVGRRREAQLLLHLVVPASGKVIDLFNFEIK